MWERYFQPATLDQALALLRDHGAAARIVAGGTDVMVELQRGIKPTTTLIDVSRLRELKYVRLESGVVKLGGLATHNDVLAWPASRRHALPLAQACAEVGAPPIRTRATVAGNLVTASPANDTITPLLALGAELSLLSAAGERVVALPDFYTGFRRTVLRADELLRELRFPALSLARRGVFRKLGLRRAQAISVVNVAVVVSFDGQRIVEAAIALGCVAPTIVRAPSAEAYLAGRVLDQAVCTEAGRLAAADIAPISDVRGSARYRLRATAGVVAEALATLAAETEGPWAMPGRPEAGWLAAQPVLLDTGAQPPAPGGDVQHIDTTINGRRYRLSAAPGTTLLHALRDDAGLVGVKEGCAEGECGACTVWLDGQAVMACLTPAPQAYGAELTTIEGLGSDAGLHPLQQSFISHGAVQCGYCIPGMLMAGAKLLDERPQPSVEEAQIALSGNICRCTGYRKILDAVVGAGRREGRGGIAHPADGADGAGAAGAAHPAIAGNPAGPAHAAIPPQPAGPAAPGNRAGAADRAHAADGAGAAIPTDAAIPADRAIPGL